MANPVMEHLTQGIVKRVEAVSDFNLKIVNALSDDLIGKTRYSKASVDLPRDIIVIGCGGTGSWLLPKLVKIINDGCSKSMTSGHNILLVDGDEVEEKNLIRQNFISQDVGKNKAQALAERYGVHFNEKCNVGYLDKFLMDQYSEITEEFADRFTLIGGLDFFNGRDIANVLIINLIDNGTTRKMIHSFAMEKSSYLPSRRSSIQKIFVLDVANNEYNGQLNASLYGVSNPSTYIAQFYNQHPSHLGDNEEVSVFSCADADAEATDQLFNANDMAATVTGNYINSWLMTGGLRFGAVEFVTGSSVRVESSLPLYDISVYWIENKLSEDRTEGMVVGTLECSDVLKWSYEEMDFHSLFSEVGCAEIRYPGCGTSASPKYGNTKTSYLRDIYHARTVK